MKEAIITITIGTIIGGTIGAILYKILCSDCTPYIITFQKGIESMNIIDGDPTHSPEDFLYLAELRQRYEELHKETK